MPEASGWCSLVMFTDMPMPFEEWADGFIPYPGCGAESRPVSVDTVELPIGEAIRVHDEYVEDEFIFATLYLFETGGSYYWLGCAQGAPAEDYWLSIAETLEPIGDEADGTTDEQVVEVPEAGIAVSFPAEWTVEIEMIEKELASDRMRSSADQLPERALRGAWRRQLVSVAAQREGGGDLLAFADTVGESYLAEHGDEATDDVSTSS